MKKYIITLSIILLANFTFAQDFFDALRYSQTEYGGTARSIAMGSAFGALGGDFVSASINPAGLGFYRSGEFILSPTLNFDQTKSSYLSNSETDQKYNFNFNNLSYIASANTGQETGIINVTFGIGYNRLKNYNSRVYIQGYNAKTTLLNYFTDYANSISNPDNFDPHYEGLAWNTWLVDEDTDPNVIEGIYYNPLSNDERYDIVNGNNEIIGSGWEAVGVKAHQQKSQITRSGHIDEYLMSLGLNANHKLYLGASLGLLDLQYSEDVLFSEIDNNNESDYFKDYSLKTRLRENGFGVNFKAGLIYRPIKSLRLGASFHTPTFYSISRSEYKDITANYDIEIGSDESGYNTKWIDDNDQYYDYKLETPLKINLSAAYSLGDKALLSLDYELLNYSSAKFREANDDNYDYSDQNSDNNKVFVSAGNLRIGAEYRLTPNFSLRGGYGLSGNPWANNFTFNDGTVSEIINKNDTYSAYSCGFGYRQNNYFIDFAYRLNHLKYAYKVHEIYYTNPDNGVAIANLNQLNSRATITFGLRF